MEIDNVCNLIEELNHADNKNDFIEKYNKINDEIKKIDCFLLENDEIEKYTFEQIVNEIEKIEINDTMELKTLKYYNNLICQYEKLLKNEKLTLQEV